MDWESSIPLNEALLQKLMAHRRAQVAKQMGKSDLTDDEWNSHYKQ